MSELDGEAMVRQYLEAFDKRELEQCMEFFCDDAQLYFGPPTLGLGKFSGWKQIEQWHKDRFEAGMRVTEVEEVDVQGETVIVHAVATSPKLKAVNIDHFRGKVTIRLDGGKIKEVRMGLRTGYRFHL